MEGAVNEAGVETGEIEATIEALGHLFALLRQFALEGADAAGGRDAAGALAAALRRAAPPFALQLLPEAVMRDGVPLPLSLEEHRRAQHLVSAFDRLGVQEMALDRVPEISELRALGEGLFSAARKGRAARLPEFEGMRLRALPSVQAGADESAIDQMTAEQVARVYVAAEALIASEGAWPWAAACSLASGLERCMASSISATARALELAPGSWTRARGAVVAAFHVGAVLSRLQVSPLSQRAALHAMLVLAAHGLAERWGRPLDEAARIAWPSLLADAAGSELDPHRLRVCALVRACACASPANGGLLVPLLHVAYELERRRCPPDVPLRLSRVDLQAWLAGALGTEVHAGFGRALLGLLGIVPVGSHVLSDGRLGVVFGSGAAGDWLRPRVLVGGAIEVPAQPVALCSPLGMTPWAK